MKYLYLLAVLIFLISCNNENQKKQDLPNDTLSISNIIKPNHKEILYYDNGQIKLVQEYFNGIKHGTYKNWYKNGTIRTLGFYYMGFRKGTWSWYSEKGKIEFQVNYDKQVANL